MTIKYYCTKCKKNVHVFRVVQPLYYPNYHAKCGGLVMLNIK